MHYELPEGPSGRDYEISTGRQASDDEIPTGTFSCDVSRDGTHANYNQSLPARVQISRRGSLAQCRARPAKKQMLPDDHEEVVAWLESREQLTYEDRGLVLALGLAELQGGRICLLPLLV